MRNERGVAMLMALITMFLLAILAGELTYQSSVYTAVVFRERDQLRATLLARTGLRLALLQLRGTLKAKKQAKTMGLGDNSTLVDRIWQTPLVLPPPDLPGLSPVETQNMAGFRKSLGLDGTVSVNISGENARMSINQIVWPAASNSSGTQGTGAEGTAAAGAASGGTVIGGASTAGSTGAGSQTPEQKAEQLKKVRDNLAQVFDTILQKKREADDAFREKYYGLKGATLVGNLAAWMDPNTAVDGEGQDKRAYYSGVQPTPYSPKEAPIASDSEYHMVRGLDDTLAKIVAENFTVQASNSLDVNTASTLLIQAMLPDLTPDAIERIDKRRHDDAQGGPFKDANDFWNFVETLGSYASLKDDFTKRGYTILGPQTSYRAVITGSSGLATKTWTADIGALPPQVDATPGQQTQANNNGNQQNQPNGNGTQNNQNKTGTGTDSSDADSLNIVYLRTE